MNKHIYTIIIGLLLAILLVLFACNTQKKSDAEQSDKDGQGNDIRTNPVIDPISNPAPDSSPISQYTVHVIRRLPHNGDRTFTQGLEIHEGYLYESTGRTAETALKKIDIETGEILFQQNLEEYFSQEMYFGEGITIWEEKIIHLSWQKKIAYFYTLDFKKTGREFHYDTEGWGLTHNDKFLIMSDGSRFIHFRDPETFEIKRTIDVGVENLNELEYVKGSIYANIWFEDFILVIDEISGTVTGKIDASELLCSQLNKQTGAVLNGIAYDSRSDTFYITGKKCPDIYEVTFEKKQNALITGHRHQDFPNLSGSS